MFNALRKAIRNVIYRPFKSGEDLWIKRAKWGEWNARLKYQVFASDGTGYNPPLIHNPFRERQEESKWQNIEDLHYEYLTEEWRIWANRAFGFIYRLLEDRIDKDAVILDVGCSSGYQLDNFYKKGFRNLWGIDPNKYCIAYGREKRPYINFVEGFFGMKQYDVQCDVLVFFGSIFRIPYRHNIFDAIDRCAAKYVVIWVQEATDDMNRDPHIGLSKKGFICIEKHTVSDVESGEGPGIDHDYIPIGKPGADGTLIELGSRDSGQITRRYFRSFFLFRRIEPRMPVGQRQTS